MSTANPTPKP